MSYTKSLVAALGLALVSSAGLATAVSATEVKVFPYKGVANFCPKGQQPVQIGGVISCGTPNMTQTYQQFMTHP